MRRSRSLSFTIDGQRRGQPLKSSTLTSATCAPQAGSGTPTGVCEFPVYGTGNAGDFSVTAAPASGTALTAGGDGDPATKHGQWVGPAVTATAITEDPEGGSKALTGTLSPAVFLSGIVATATGRRSGRPAKWASSSSSRTPVAAWP